MNRFHHEAGLAAIVLLLSVSLASAAGSGRSAADVDRLIQIIQDPRATLYQKARACQQLGEFGTAKAVPALAALLEDEKLSAFARSGLEGIPGPAPAAALRSAVGRLEGDRLKGAINSLAVLRDPEAIPLLISQTRSPAAGIAQHAWLALGRIPGEKALAAIRKGLSAGAPDTRALAAPAALLAAELRLQSGDQRTAISLYDAVRQADVPSPFRLGAINGAVIARGADSTGLILSLLRSGEPEIRNAGLLAVRSAPHSDKLAEALIAEMDKAAPGLQSQLIEAAGDCRNARSLPAIRAKAQSTSAPVREAVLRTLSKAADPADAELLLNGLLRSVTPGESSAAITGLTRLVSPALDSLIVKQLAQSRDTATRLRLIHLLGARSPQAGGVELLRQADGPDRGIQVAALEALRSIVGPQHVAALIPITKAATDGSVRAAAESALAYALTRGEDNTQAAQLLLRELKQTSEALDQASWIRTLAAAGYPEALPAMLIHARGPNAWLAGVTVDQLAKWPDPSPVADLLSLAESAQAGAIRAKALTAAVQLAAQTGSERKASVENVRGWFLRAKSIARTTSENRVIISGLANWRDISAVRLLASYLDDREVRAEAALAITTAAAPLTQGPDASVLKPVLDSLDGIGGVALADRVKQLRQSIAAAEQAEPGNSLAR